MRLCSFPPRIMPANKSRGRVAWKDLAGSVGKAHRLYTEMAATGHAERLARDRGGVFDVHLEGKTMFSRKDVGCLPLRVFSFPNHLERW